MNMPAYWVVSAVSWYRLCEIVAILYGTQLKAVFDIFNEHNVNIKKLL